MSRVYRQIFHQTRLLKSSKLDCFCPKLEGRIFSRCINTDNDEERPKDPALRFFKWGYKPLPTQTVFDKPDHQFSVHSPEFKLPKRRGRLSRRSWRQKIAELQEARNKPELEKLSRERKLYVDLDFINKEWREEFGLYDINKLSKFYGINRDMYSGEDIIVKTWLDIMFNDIKIHRGNFAQPNQLLSPPSDIEYTCTEDTLHTLIVTNLDGHPVDNTKEIVQWMICNVPGNNIQDGAVIYNYLPPMPFKGTGFNRLVFMLCEQNMKMNIAPVKPDELMSISDRTLSTNDFISTHNLVPVGLAWCQVDWDESVSESCKQMSDLTDEPVFDWEEYVTPKNEAKDLNRRLKELAYRNM